MTKALPVLLLLGSAVLWAQPPAQLPAQPPKQPPKRAAAPAAARLVMNVHVTDPSGNPLPNVKVTASGPVPRDGTTGQDGTVRFTTMRPGTYRLRFTADGFLTLERDEVVRATSPVTVDAMLDPAPKPPPPPPPPATPPPAAAPAEPGTVAMLSLPDWIEKNFIGSREPSREATVGRTAGAAAAVLQLRQPVNDQTDARSDRMFYVIAGNGTMRIGGREESVEGGWLTVVPRDTTYSIVPKGRNPLVLLSISAPPSSNQEARTSPRGQR